MAPIFRKSLAESSSNTKSDLAKNNKKPTQQPTSPPSKKQRILNRQFEAEKQQQEADDNARKLQQQQRIAYSSSTTVRSSGIGDDDGGGEEEEEEADDDEEEMDDTDSDDIEGSSSHYAAQAAILDKQRQGLFNIIASDQLTSGLYDNIAAPSDTDLVNGQLETTSQLPGTSGGGGGGTGKRAVRLLKNREAARECRRKKKEYIRCLESRVAVLENQNKALIEELKTLKELYCKSISDITGKSSSVGTNVIAVNTHTKHNTLLGNARLGTRMGAAATLSANNNSILNATSTDSQAAGEASLSQKLKSIRAKTFSSPAPTNAATLSALTNVSTTSSQPVVAASTIPVLNQQQQQQQTNAITLSGGGGGLTFPGLGSGISLPVLTGAGGARYLLIQTPHNFFTTNTSSGGLQGMTCLSGIDGTNTIFTPTFTTADAAGLIGNGIMMS